VIGILDEADGKHVRLLLDDGAREFLDIGSHALEAKLVALICAVLLAHADDEHFADAALDLAAEVRVGLDAADRDQEIRRIGELVQMDLQAALRMRDHLSIHGGADRSAHGLLRHAVALDDAALTLSLGARVAAHGGDDKRVCADRLDLIADGADDAGDVRHITAARGNADTVAGLDAVERALAAHSLRNGALDVIDMAVVHLMTDADKFRDLVIGQQLIKDIHALSSAVPRKPGHGLYAVNYASSGMR